MLASVENWKRTPPVGCEVAPVPGSGSFSSTTTRRPGSRSSRWYATEAPMMPAPTMTTSAVWLTRPAGSGGTRPEAVAHRLVHHPDQRGDIEDGQAGGGLDVGAVGRHVGALEHDRADLGMLGHQAPGHREGLLPGRLHAADEALGPQQPG